MTGKMKTAVMENIGKIGYTQRDIPKPGIGEVLVKIEYVGVCGSELHYFQHGRIGDFIVHYPFVLGHEAAGTVVDAAPGVTHLKPGDRVALEPGKTCGQCEFCSKGLYNLCPDVIFFATPPVDGVFSEYVAHEAKLCFKLPDNVSTLEGALIEPLSVGFHAASMGGAKQGQAAAVFGAGCIGLVSMLALKAEGVEKVFVVDIVQARLEKALSLGASGIINAKERDTADALMELSGGKGLDLIIETSGAEASAVAAVNTAKKGSSIVLVGYSDSGSMNLPVSVAINKELTFKTVFRYRDIYPKAIRAVSEGRVNLKDIVTHHFDFDNLQTALQQSVMDKENIVKSVIKL